MKGSITENLGDGLYRVEIDYDTDRLDAEIKALNDRRIANVQKLLNAQIAANAAVQVVNAAADAVEDLIRAYKATGDPFPTQADDIVQAMAVLAQANADRNAAQFTVSRLQAEQASIAIRINALKSYRRVATRQRDAGARDIYRCDFDDGRVVYTDRNIPGGNCVVINPEQDNSIEMWCADFSDELEVGTPVGCATVPGEQFLNMPIILPQSREDGELQGFDRRRDGQMVPLMSMSPSAAFYNLALLPGWQRWMPTYRTAKVERVDVVNDTVDIIINRNESSQKDEWGRRFPTEIGQAILYRDNVPVRYMSCNAAVFEEGDEVLVRFKSNTNLSALAASGTVGEQAWDVSNMEVVGFVDHPRVCSFPGIFTARPQVTKAEGGSWWLFGITLFYKDDSGSWKSQPDNVISQENYNWYDKEALNWTWYNEDDTIMVARSGVKSRSIQPREPDQTRFSGIVLIWDKKGRFLEIPSPGGNVSGCAINGEYVIVTTTYTRSIEKIYKARWRLYDPPDEEDEESSAEVFEWIEIGEYTWPDDYGHVVGWAFNSGGTEARCLMRNWQQPPYSSPDPSVNHVYRLTISGGDAGSATISILKSGSPLVRNTSVSGQGVSGIWVYPDEPPVTFSWNESINVTQQGTDYIAVDWVDGQWVEATINHTYTETSQYSGGGVVVSEGDADSGYRSGSASHNESLTIDLGFDTVNVTMSVEHTTEDSYGSAGGDHSSDRTSANAFGAIKVRYLDIRNKEIVYELTEIDNGTNATNSNWTTRHYSNSEKSVKKRLISLRDGVLLESIKTTPADSGSEPLVFEDDLGGTRKLSYFGRTAWVIVNPGDSTDYYNGPSDKIAPWPTDGNFEGAVRKNNLMCSIEMVDWYELNDGEDFYFNYLTEADLAQVSEIDDHPQTRIRDIREHL